MSARAFVVDGRPFLAPRYGDMLRVLNALREIPRLKPSPTMADVADWNVRSLPVWVEAMRSAWPAPDFPAANEEAELWLMDAGWELPTIITCGSGIVREYQRRLGYVAAEKVESEASFTARQ